VLRGPSDASGGLRTTSSSVSLGTAGQPALYRGQVTSLAGTNMAATLTGSSGTGLILSVSLQVDQASSAVTGTVRAVAPVAQPGGSGGTSGTGGPTGDSGTSGESG